MKRIIHKHKVKKHLDPAGIVIWKQMTKQEAELPDIFIIFTKDILN